MTLKGSGRSCLPHSRGRLLIIPFSLLNIANNRLTSFLNFNSLYAYELRSAAPQPAHRLNQDGESARQPTRRCRRCQDIAMAISFAKSSKDGHCRRMHASHLDHDRALGLVPRLLAFDESQGGVETDLRQSAVWQTRGGLELKQGRVDEVHGNAAKGCLEPVEPCLAITVRRMRLCNVGVDALQFDTDRRFPGPSRHLVQLRLTPAAISIPC
jgi:hypothetical protein